MAWESILDGEVAERGWEVVRRIAEEIRANDCDAGGSLEDGQAGLALFYGYLALAEPDRDWMGTARSLLNQSIATLSQRKMTPALFGGFTGIAWTVNHFQKHIFHSAEDFNGGIDKVLLNYVSTSPWRSDFDLVSGLAGLGVYGADRMESGILEQIVARLSEKSISFPDGSLSWFTDPCLLVDWQRALYPKGYYNLGLAHGVPGCIAILGLAFRLGISEATCLRLLEGSVKWLLAQRGLEGDRSLFDKWIAPDAKLKSESSHFAWCYGDLGIASALLFTARNTGRLDWGVEAMSIGRHTTKFLPEGAQNIDPRLCHGTSGCALIYNRLYQATGDPLFREAAVANYARTVQTAYPGSGDADTWLRWEGERNSLLSGLAGIGLSLLAGLTSTEPAWDQILLSRMAP